MSYFYIIKHFKELFSWKTTSLKAHLEVCLPKSRLLSGLIGMWSSMKITLYIKSHMGEWLVSIFFNFYQLPSLSLNLNQVPKNNSWTLVFGIIHINNYFRRGLVASWVGDSVLACGGGGLNDTSGDTMCWSWSPATNAWSPAPPLSRDRHFGSVVKVSSELVIGCSDWQD